MDEETVKEMKEKLVEYWTNLVQLPMGIQLKSLAIIDMVIEAKK